MTLMCLSSNGTQSFIPEAQVLPRIMTESGALNQCISKKTVHCTYICMRMDECGIKVPRYVSEITALYSKMCKKSNVIEGHPCSLLFYCDK